MTDRLASARLAVSKALAGEWDQAVHCLESANAEAAFHLQSALQEKERQGRAEFPRSPARPEKRNVEDRHRECAEAKASGQTDWELDLLFGAGVREDWERDLLSAQDGDTHAALLMSLRLQGLGDTSGAEKLLRSALENGGQSQWPYRGQSMIRLAEMLQDKSDPEAGVWLRKAASEGSDEAAELAAQWCLTNGLVEEGEFRFEVLVQRGREKMRSAVAYLDSEWKTYRHQWTETNANMWAWCRAMRREMLHAAASGNINEAGLLLCAVSESRDWSPEPEDIIVGAGLGTSGRRTGAFFLAASRLGR